MGGRRVSDGVSLTGEDRRKSSAQYQAALETQMADCHRAGVLQGWQEAGRGVSDDMRAAVMRAATVAKRPDVAMQHFRRSLDVGPDIRSPAARPVFGCMCRCLHVRAWPADVLFQGLCMGAISTAGLAAAHERVVQPLLPT